MSKLPKNFYNNVDAHKMGLDEIADVASEVAALQTTVGDADSGLVKDVADIKTTVGDSSSGLVKDVSDLQTTVGDSSSGLVKDVSDLQNTVRDTHIMFAADYSSSESPISVMIDITGLVINPYTVMDIYTSVFGISITSATISGNTLTVVIPAQASDGTIIAVFTNASMTHA